MAIKHPPYSTADTTDNDFGCRMYHLLLAAETGMVGTECPKIVPGSSVCTM
jgi:hypothetical protein